MDGKSWAELEERLDRLEARVLAIEVAGSPNLATRIALLEKETQRILDPELGIYPRLRQSNDRLRAWALALLTALVLLLVGLIAHILAPPP